MPYIIQDNSVSRDLPHIRQARLDLIEANIGALAPELSLPPELLAWAVNAAGNYRAAFTNVEIQWGQKEEAIQTVQEAEDALRDRYVVLKELLHARYADDKTKNAYGIVGEIPEPRGMLESKANKLIENHGIQVAAGDPMVLPDVMIANFIALRDAMHSAQIAAEKEFTEATDSTKEALRIFDADSYQLRVLYNWCVAVWGRESSKLVLLGFVQRYPEQGGSGGDMPAVPEGFELKWLEPFLKFWWLPVEGATSYQLAFSADGGASWEELYSGPEVGFEFEPPAGKRLYRVRARNANGFGDWSVTLEHEVEGEPPANMWPNAPEVVGAELITDPGFFMRVFYSIPGGSDTINLYRAVVPTGSPAPERPAAPYQTDITAPQFADTDIEAGNDYYYWACGVKDGVEGDFAGPAMASV